jgi:hypothetical protein
MKTLFALLLALATVQAGAQIHLTASLSGAQEVPSVVTTATGTGSFSLNDDMTELRYAVAYQGLSGTLTAGGHFHVGTPGRTGSVVKAIASLGDPASNTISGIWKASDATQPLTTALVESLLTGRLYVNFHTPVNPGGEIRGQVTLATALQFTVDLDGTQEVPSVATTAGGTGVFVLSPDRSEMEYTIAYRELSGVLSAGGHVHVGAAGRSGGVVKGIAVSGDPASAFLKNKWRSSDSNQPLTSALVDSAIAGKLYVNFHTAANPGGEIRGQLTLRGGTGYAASLEGSKEVPAVTADGRGAGYLVLNGARTEAQYAVTYFGLTGSLTAGGHFHIGGVGRNGSVVKGIAISGGGAAGTVTGSWRSTDPSQPLTTALAESLMSGRLYVNFHTASNPGGEIRGQIDMTTGVGFSVMLDGSQESPPVTTAGKGAGYAVLNGERNDLRYRVTYHGLSGPLTAGGHFHLGGHGRNGAVVKGIAVSGDSASGTVDGDWATSDGTQPLTDISKDSLFAGNVYVNFHTAANPGGEIRGYLDFPTPALTGVERVNELVPEGFVLGQNYPNPFNPTTIIPFSVARSERVVLDVYSVLGQRVAVLVDAILETGNHAVPFDASGLSSGMYVYRLVPSSGRIQARTMMILK